MCDEETIRILQECNRYERFRHDEVIRPRWLPYERPSARALATPSGPRQGRHFCLGAVHLARNFPAQCPGKKVFICIDRR